jgi:hypothetical protein
VEPHHSATLATWMNQVGRESAFVSSVSRNELCTSREPNTLSTSLHGSGTRLATPPSDAHQPKTITTKLLTTKTSQKHQKEKKKTSQKPHNQLLLEHSTPHSIDMDTNRFLWRDGMACIPLSDFLEGFTHNVVCMNCRKLNVQSMSVRGRGNA